MLHDAPLSQSSSKELAAIPAVCYSGPKAFYLLVEVELALHPAHQNDPAKVIGEGEAQRGIEGSSSKEDMLVCFPLLAQLEGIGLLIDI